MFYGLDSRFISWEICEDQIQFYNPFMQKTGKLQMSFLLFLVPVFALSWRFLVSLILLLHFNYFSLISKIGKFIMYYNLIATKT